MADNKPNSSLGVESICRNDQTTKNVDGMIKEKAVDRRLVGFCREHIFDNTSFGILGALMVNLTCFTPFFAWLTYDPIFTRNLDRRVVTAFRDQMIVPFANYVTGPLFVCWILIGIYTSVRDDICSVGKFDCSWCEDMSTRKKRREMVHRGAKLRRIMIILNWILGIWCIFVFVLWTTFPPPPMVPLWTIIFE